MLWTTHLNDEICDDVTVTVLNRGEVQADCSAPGLLKYTGAKTYEEAVLALKQDKDAA